MRVFAISDLHTDMASNLAWLAGLSDEAYKQDALIVAGDVSEKKALVIATLAVLKAKFAEVFFVAGNHDVWDATNSLAKLDDLYDSLKKIGVHCEPALVGGKVWIVPLESWHYYDLDLHGEGDMDLSRLRLWRDFERCKWLPSAVGSSSTAYEETFDPAAKLAESRAVARLMMERNEATVERVRAMQSIRHLPVITFSHFVPRADLNPHFRRFKELRAVSVCPMLDPVIRNLRANVHVFGHTHHRTDSTIEGIRYIQFPLGYPSEGLYCPRYDDLNPNEIVF